MSTEPEFLVNKATINLVLRRHHMCHEGFAWTIHTSRSYWSLCFNRRRSLSFRLRRRLIECPLLKGIPESELWDEVGGKP